MKHNRITTTLLGAALLVGAAFTAPVSFAQQPNEDFRKQKPAPLPAKPFNLAKPYETTLANGLQVIIVEDKRLPLVSYRLAFRRGSINDPAELPGLASVTAGLLDEGTTTRDSKQIADEIARYGASLNANAGADFITVSASSLSKYADNVLGLMADVALNPAFPEKEVQLALQNRRQSLTTQRAQAAFLSNERLSRVLYGDHPYGTVTPTAESLSAITREKLAAFHQANFTPDNAVLVVVGDVNRAATVKRLESLFGAWKKGTAVSNKFTEPPVRKVRTLYVVDRPGAAQSNIVIANLAIARNSTDYFPTLVMNQILGGGSSGRLFLNLREKHGYTYGAYSALDTRQLAGAFRASAEVRTPVTGDSLKEFFAELDRIRDEKVNGTDLTNAKAYLTGVFPIRLETQEGLTNALLDMKIYGLPADYLTGYRERINAVTAEDVQRVAQKYVTPGQSAVVIVGDYSVIAPQIKSYATDVEVFETSGKPRTGDAPATGTGGGATTAPLSNNLTSGGMTGAASFMGNWNLAIEAPGQTLQATLKLEDAGGSWKGVVVTPFGDAPLSDIKINGNKMDAKISVNAQGQMLDGTVTGTIDGSKMTGSVNLSAYPPLPFTGVKGN